MTNKSVDKKVNSKNTDLSNWNSLVNLIKSVSDINELKKYFSDHINSIISKAELQNTDVLFLFDEESITEWTSNRIYESLSNFDSTKILLLIVHSPGGSVEQAYFISKEVKRKSKKFIFAVPRKAKSAATLISLGADEIHMGTVSQLGPIDPQINGLPALGVLNAVENIAGICQRNPGASEMFAKYLSIKLEPVMFGYFERIAESSMQYAQRLLENKKLPNTPDQIPVWTRLVYEYKDHGFVIDSDEAIKLLGQDIVKVNTKELELSEKIFTFLDQCNLLLRVFRQHRLSVVGNSLDGMMFHQVDQN